MKKTALVKILTKLEKTALKYDYVKNWKKVSLLQMAFILTLYYVFSDAISGFVNIYTAFLIIGSILVGYATYFIINKKGNIQKSETLHNDFRSFDYKFFTTKSIDVLAQQIIVIALLVILKNSLTTFIAIFIALHLVNFLYKKFDISFFYFLFSIPAALVFYFIYNLHIKSGLGLAYTVHLFFYICAGVGYAIYKKFYEEKLTTRFNFDFNFNIRNLRR